MAEEQLLPDERLQELSDSLLASVVGSDEASIDRRRYLFGQLPTLVFKEENYVLYKVLYTFKDRGITPDAEFLKMYLMRNVGMLHDSHINLNAYGEEDVEVGYVGSVINQHTRLRGMPPLDMDAFKLAIEKYKVEYSGLRMSEAYSEARLMLYDGVQIGRRLYQGYEDSMAYIKSISAEVDSLLNAGVGDGFIDSRVEGVIDDDRHDAEKVSDFDLIDELNEYLGGIYSGLLYNVLAPTKGGKSKFTARIVHTAIVKYHVNCSVWAWEGGYKAWWAQLRAIHYEWMYMRNEDAKPPAPLSQRDILFNQYPSDAVRRLEEASRIDLFTNDKYGVINMIDRPLRVETFIDDLDTSVKINNSKLVLIDYLQLIESEDRRKGVQECVKSAYKQALHFAGERNVAIISPAQFTQEFIKMKAGKAGTAIGSPDETRTAGGESSEVTRSADINIALYASIDDLQRNSMQIMSVPSRLAVAFPAFEIYADLCSCVFSSIERGES